MKELTTKIQEQLAGNFEVTGNNITLKAGSYDSAVTELTNVTAAQAKEVHNFDKHYIPGFVAASGEVGIDVLKKHSEFNEVTATTKVGNATVVSTVERKGERPAGAPKPGQAMETVEVAGYTTVKVKTKLGEELKHARDHNAALALKHL